MRYACLIYFDPKVLFNQSPEAQAVLAESAPTTPSSGPAATSWRPKR